MMLLILVIIFALIIGFLVGKYLTEQKIKSSRKDAVKRSRNSLVGKLLENIAPYLPDFQFNPLDMRFIGSPIDYIVFQGMSKKEIDKVIFLEIKSGKSSLNSQERKLKKAIQNKKVEYKEIRLDEIEDIENFE
jgi:predicted Holliday junction resolvase-like endonuclease